MVIVSELWIGDMLQLKKTGRIGKYSGVSRDQKIKVKVGNKIVLTTPQNLEYAPDNHSDNSTNYIERPSFTLQKPRPLNSVIDLHMESLNPSMINARPERIIDYQISEADNFIKDAIHRKLPKIEIIHGKGTGVLKMEVEHLLHLYDEHIKVTFPTNAGGAVEVWFSNPI